MPENRAWIAVVDRAAAQYKTRHVIGLPPEIAVGANSRTDLPRAAVVVIRPDGEGGFMLDRYTSDGDDAGDTWHASMEHAREQASFEFEDGLGPWEELPSHALHDVPAYIRKRYSS